MIAQSEIITAIGDSPPGTYFIELMEQVNGGERRYGGTWEPDSLRESLVENCLPERLIDGGSPDYGDFLAERRRLMSLKIKAWFETLS